MPNQERWHGLDTLPDTILEVTQLHIALRYITGIGMAGGV